ncbi:uncharacterized protein A4U43_C03F28910 [Asparagus officinalis]|uniref:poly(A)-specific ribonuclease n=1 Tax=Asparagus officinalis TaxID=4686 RepID=A0A5P1FHY6_ASPOF|nr:probable CCR4-associated factor 1 homolog 11 [Asparagus officinalis]XP_020259058.1 probable CCR4-associated factor 1 homolog 11 [Asparagus officinalis]ONK76509.1 uncharacterized protein A4U43_C03F28910 [Asparagus officinalis]
MIKELNLQHVRDKEAMILQEVWRHNLHEELNLISELRRSCNFVFVDTEFPGFLKPAPHRAPREDTYSALKYNVDRMKLVQVGITLSDSKRFFTWQFNLKDFDPEVDNCSKDSIEFLKRNGIDFCKNGKDGVSAAVLSKGLTEKLIRGCEGLRWVTFHGLYDLAYLIKIVYKMPLPETLNGFLGLVRELFGAMVFDVKYMAKECDARFAEAGLLKLSRMLEINWKGTSRQAGRDSLLTAMVFWEMKKRFADFNEEAHAGALYELEEHARDESVNVATTSYDRVAPVRVSRGPGSVPFGYAMLPSPSSMPPHGYPPVAVGYCPPPYGYWLAPGPFFYAPPQ